MFLLFLGKLCGFCETVDPEPLEIPRVRRPFPVQKREGLHYCSLEETPNEGREVDDYQPRVALKKVFADGKMPAILNVILWVIICCWSLNVMLSVQGRSVMKMLLRNLAKLCCRKNLGNSVLGPSSRARKK